MPQFAFLKLAAALALLSAHSAFAQSKERLAAVEPFSLWVGEWKGTGWSTNSGGERTEFALAESVKEKAGGTVLLVEGHGTRTSGPARGTVSHDGLVTVYRDASGHLRWNGHEAASGPIDADIVLDAHGFSWTFAADARGTRIRFVIALDGNEWRETGELSADGTSWTRFMEMKLIRSTASP